MGKKEGVIEALRFIGMLFIYLCHLDFIHYSSNLKIKSIAEYFQLGGVGVELFIVMSGFAITLGYFNKNISFKDFILRRLNRIYPVYFIFLVAGAFYMYNYFLTSPILTFAKFFQHLLFLQTISPIPQSATAFNGAAWTVATLFICYLATPILFKGLKYKTKTTITLLFIYILIINIISLYFKDNYSANFNIWLTYLSPFFRFIDFFIGVSFGILFLKTQNELKKLYTSYFSFIEILITAIWIYFTFNPINTQIYGVICAGLLTVYSFQKGFISKFFKHQIWFKLGALSYSFYLCHYLILMVTNKILNQHHITTDYGIIIASISCFALSIIIAYVVNKKIEPKLNNWFSHKIQNVFCYKN